MKRGQHFKAEQNEIVKHLGTRAKVINVEWCSYTKQHLYDIKELMPPYEQIRAVGALWGCLEKIK